MSKVMVVDDEEGIRKMMRLSLEMDGYEVFTAQDGPSALEIFHREKPRIVFLDVRMPGMDGLEVLGRIKADAPETEVVVVTGHGDMEMAIECLRREASNFLLKPVSDEILLWALKRAEEKLALKRKVRQYTENLRTLVREANVELEKSYRFRENLIENSPDAIVSVRKGGEIVIFNAAAERLLKYKKDEVIGKLNIVHIYPPGVAKRVMRDLRSEDFGGTGVLQKQELRVVSRDGEEIPVYLSAAILYEEGKEAGSVGVFTDLRERKALESQLLRSEKLSSLGKLSAGIAHEINQPLTGVLTFASLLRSKYESDEETRHDLDVIVRETTRIRKIVQGMLDFARETPMQKKSARVEDILDQVLTIVQNQQRFFGIEITKDYGDNVPEVVVDPSQIEQVFMNLLLNAADAMDSSGVLTLRTRAQDTRVKIDFQDSGRGMPPSILDKIFDPFFTTKDSTEGTGMGLGLAVSYGIVKNHDGEITVSSREGVGTTFTVELPLEDPESTPS